MTIKKPRLFKDISKIKAEVWFEDLFKTFEKKMNGSGQYQTHTFVADNGVWALKIDAGGLYCQLHISRDSAISEKLIEDFNLNKEEIKVILKKVILKYYPSIKISSIKLKKTKINADGKIVPINNL